MTDQQTMFYVISDCTGKTAKNLVESASGQYPDYQVEKKNFPFVRSNDRIDEILEKAENEDAIIVFTFVKESMRKHLVENAEAKGLEYVDMMTKPINILTERLEAEPKEIFALKYKLDEAYFKRIEAMEFTLKFDDLNESKGIEEADIVLVGVSRTSKTPLSIHLSYLGYKTANIPLVPEVDVNPAILENKDNKIIGLTIDPKKLNNIRIERLKKMGLGDDATYAAKERIKEEFEYADSIMDQIGCPVIDVTDKTIEETAVEVLSYFNE